MNLFLFLLSPGKQKEKTQTSLRSQTLCCLHEKAVNTGESKTATDYFNGIIQYVLWRTSENVYI